MPPSANLLTTSYRPLRPFKVHGIVRVIRSADLSHDELELHQFRNVDLISVLKFVATRTGDEDSIVASNQPGLVRAGFPLHHRLPVFNEELLALLKDREVPPGNLIRLSRIGEELG